MSGTVKVRCKCTNEFQDKAYGQGVRVANLNAKGEAVCTVCAAKHLVSGYSFEKKGKK